VFAFDATYDEAGATKAERAFYVRSVLQLRRWQTFGPPCFFAAAVAVGLRVAVPSWVVAFFIAFLVISVIGPLVFLVARPGAAGRLARKYPVRHVTLTQEAVEITAGGQKAVVAWPRVKYVWEAGDYLLLVLGKFGNISVPRKSLPPGASEFIHASAGRAT
jgi:hypothetical protein